MKIAISVSVLTLLLSGAPLSDASAQRRVVSSPRVAPSGAERAGTPRRAVVPREVRRRDDTPRSTRGERSGPVIVPADARPRGGSWHGTRDRHRLPPRFGGYDRYDPYGYWTPGAYPRHHGLYVGAPFGSAFVILATPVIYSTYAYAAPYSLRYSAAGARTLLQGDIGDAADALRVEELRGGVVRLSWHPDGREVEEVGLFLADARQNVLAVQTLRAAPYAALFEPTYAAAYIGVTIAYADGQSTTTLIPYSPR